MRISFLQRLINLALLLTLAAFFTSSALAQSKMPQRSEIKDKYKWDLSHIYPDWEAWRQGLAEIEQKMNDLQRFQGTLAGGPENLLRAFQLNDEVDILSYRVYRYPQLAYALDTRDPEAGAGLQQVQGVFARFGTATAWLTPELLSIGWDTMSTWLDKFEGLAPYRHPIEDAYRLQQHVLSEDKERLLSYYSILGSTPTDAHRALSTADIDYREVVLSDGDTVILTPGNYRSVLTTRENQADRAAAYDTYYKTYSDNANTYATIYNGILQRDWANAQARNYQSCMEAGLNGYNVPPMVLENLIASVKRGLGPLHRYFKIRKEALGIEEYHNYDGSYPIVDFHKTYEYDEIVDWIIESVGPVGKAYQDRVKEAFENRWVDVYETPNKATGAFNASCYGVHPYILMNYNKTLESAFTLAHEVAHAMHSVLAETHQPKATSSFTLLGAEVASAVNEALLTDYLVKRSNDPLERAALLLRTIDDLSGVFYTQVKFAEFEVEAHRMAERGEPVTAETLSELFARISDEHGGDIVTEDSLYRYTWARIDHFYEVPYYVYQYAASFAVAAQLIDDITSDDQARRQDALDRFLTFLEAGGSDYPIELMKKAGADLTRPETFDAVIALMDRLVTQLEEEMARL
ncbi:MAG: oligoendopeptidase F [candidate division Zixibacteria bacterium]|nr:oligoendopeptidase F [candidate division Zixibacteria bacterium]